MVQGADHKFPDKSIVVVDEKIVSMSKYNALFAYIG